MWGLIPLALSVILVTTSFFVFSILSVYGVFKIFKPLKF